MKYLYTAPDCPRCVKRKKELSLQGIVYEEREGSRLTNPANHDDIDVDAFVKLSQQNMVLPVEVDYHDK
jgi:hypothetical protein